MESLRLSLICQRGQGSFDQLVIVGAKEESPKPADPATPNAPPAAPAGPTLTELERMRLEDARSELENGSTLIALDVLGCGHDEAVLITTGSVAASYFSKIKAPIDALIIGSIDE